MVEQRMIPVGYMAKIIRPAPEALMEAGVNDIYSVSNCISEAFTDYIKFWKHNGYWFFDSPQIIQQLAQEHSIDLTETKLFYYEVYELEFHQDTKWKPFKQEASVETNIFKLNSKKLEGYDVVTFFAGNSPEYSPLSCNGLAKEIKVNSHCLLSSFEDAYQLLEQGKFTNSEPGPYRIFSVFFSEWV